MFLFNCLSTDKTQKLVIMLYTVIIKVYIAYKRGVFKFKLIFIN